jgi:hypothetical protein
LKCKICGVRRARRFCPGTDGDICSICCGTERENTIRCPFTCVYLQEARVRDRPAPPDPASLPNRDIVIRDEFVQQHAEPISILAAILVRSALLETDAVDNDIRDALEALIRTYRTLQTGLYYDTRPANAVAARIFDRFQEAVSEYRKDMQRQALSWPGDSEVLTILAFLQRIELDRNNGRRLGRAFLDYLQRSVKGLEEARRETSPLIHTI